MLNTNSTDGTTFDSRSAFDVPVPRDERATAQLVGTHVVLRHVAPLDYDYLYQLATRPENLIGWRFRGAPPSPEQFAGSLWSAVLCQFLITRTDGQPIGLVSAYNADHRSGVAYLAAIVDPKYEGSGWWLEAVALFVDHLFRVWRLRKLCMETLEFNYSRFASGAGHLFQVEGCQLEQEYFDGRYWHVYILAMCRTDWEHIRERFARLVQST